MQHGSEFIYKESDGGFFRMFPIPGTRFKNSTLFHISRLLNSQPNRGNGLHPAGYTYLGQFIDHDITRLKRHTEHPTNGPVQTWSLIQERTSGLDLDNLYGDGLLDNIVRYKADGKFYSESTFENGIIYDLPRQLGMNGYMAFIKDSRNDENLIVAQMHVLFMNIHNCFIDFFRSRLGISDLDKCFDLSRKALTLLYQQIIIRDFLERFLDTDVFNHIFPKDDFESPTYLNSIPGEEARIPIEFSGAAFRFGHSMIRGSYKINQNASLDLHQLFSLTGRGGMKLSGNSVDMKEFTVCWKSFFNIDDTIPTRISPIDPLLNYKLRDMANEKPGMQNLTDRNLLRGKELDLPCAQDIIKELNKQGIYDIGDPISVEDYPAFSDPRHLASLDLSPTGKGITEKTPLWLYILLEPHFLEGFDQYNKLGKLGSIIIGETFRLLVNCSNESLFNPHLGEEGELQELFDDINKDTNKDRDYFAVPMFRITDLINYVYRNEQ